MIVGDLNIVGVSFFPKETDPLLIIDPDTVLPFPVTGKLLQAIARRNSQVIQRHGRINNFKLPQGRRQASDFALRATTDKTAGKQDRQSWIPGLGPE